MDRLNKNVNNFKKNNIDKSSSGLSSLNLKKIKKLKGDDQVEEFDEMNLFQYVDNIIPIKIERKSSLLCSCIV